MAPTSGKKNRQQRDSLKAEDILQAIVIADSFNNAFDPVTLNQPTVLMPLVNVPILDYTLEFLRAAGVQEIFVFCCNHADQIRKHLERSRWLEETCACSVTVIVSDDCLSVGDALREVDSKAMIRTDFILVFGDTVANVRLKDVMDAHRKTKEKDKSSVLTMVYKKASPKHHARCAEDDTVLVIDSDTRKILHYKKTGNEKNFHIPVEIFSEHPSVAIHYDLMNTHICVCSPLVPQLFTDNFDYSTMDDFVRGLLINEEILGNTIHMETVTDSYACRVSNLSQYDAVSRDVIRRWPYPYVPEMMSPGTSCGRHSVYTSTGITLARGCVLEKNVVIGTGTSIGTNSSISNSVIGRNCEIGENVTIEGSYIWDNVKIKDNCSLNMCIVADNCIVYNNVTICAGCVLASKVEVGPCVQLPIHTSLMSTPHADNDDFGIDLKDDVITQEDQPDYGNLAYIFNAPCDSDDEEGDASRDLWGLTSQRDDESDDSSVSSGDSDALSHTDEMVHDDAKVFYSEMFETLRRAKEENIGADNQVLEINSLKHAYNITINDVNTMVVQALLEMPHTEQPDLEAPQYFPALKKCFKMYLGLLQNYIKNTESQHNCLQSLEEYFLKEEGLSSSLVKAIHFLYDADIINEEVIVSWYGNVPDNEEKSERLLLRKPVAPFIKWLQEADEESDDSGD